jgi:hypothetical protein
MAQYIAVRALNRSSQVRLVNSDGDKVKLTPTEDVVVNLDLASNRRELARHGTFGQYIVTAANDSVGAVDLPANS